MSIIMNFSTLYFIEMSQIVELVLIIYICHFVLVNHVSGYLLFKVFPNGQRSAEQDFIPFKQNQIPHSQNQIFWQTSRKECQKPLHGKYIGQRWFVICSYQSRKKECFIMYKFNFSSVVILYFSKCHIVNSNYKTDRNRDIYFSYFLIFLRLYYIKISRTASIIYTFNVRTRSYSIVCT